MSAARGRLLIFAIGGLTIALVVALRSTAGPPAPAATATPLPTALVFPLPTPEPGSLQLETRPLQDPVGDWAFFIQRGLGSTNRIEISDSLIAVRLSDGRAQSVATMRCNSVNCGPATSTRLLDQQFSPDGRHLVLSVATLTGDRATLVITELATGEARLLTRDPRYSDVSPRWSPDGSRIAFVRTEIGVGDAGVFTIQPTGQQLRQVIRGPERPNNTLLYGWTADMTGLAFDQGFEDAYYKVYELATGQIREFKGQTLGIATGHWRRGDPAFVGNFGGGKGADQTLEVASGPGSAQRVLATQSGPNAWFMYPRWRPTGDDVLTVLSNAQTETHRNAVLIVSSTTGQRRQVAAHDGGQMHARWSPDGASVVFLEESGVSAALGIVRADGTGERLFFSTGGAPEARIDYPDLAVVRIR